jgi:DivIVA domain-containing protein
MIRPYGDLVESISNARFSPVRLHEGYEMSAVDDLLDRVVAALGRGDSALDLLDGAVLPRVRWREGYDTDEVDAFLAGLRRSVASDAGEAR